jgi:hypothetical protein
MATSKNGNRGRLKARQSLPVCLCAAITALVLTQCAMLEGADPPPRLIQRYENLHREAREQFSRNTNDVQIAWQFGRACFDWAELPRPDVQREAIALEGIASCRRALVLDPKSAPARYYLAFNLGQLARTKLLGALNLVNDMERELLAAIELEPKFDHAGPHRALGRLYVEAPGWPLSIGNRAKGRFHLEKAFELDAAFPANSIHLLEAFHRWGEQSTLQARIGSVQKMLDKARQELTGDQWALDWLEWDEIWQRIKTGTPPTPTNSPTQKKS